MKNCKPEYCQANCSDIKTPFPRVKLTCIGIYGDCYHGYEVGDELILGDFTHPPKHFCMGLGHAVFPVVYALSFGARFRFMSNQRSLKVTCPDGGRAEFLVELLDKEGKVEFEEKDSNFKGPDPKNLQIEVIKAKGHCTYGYKVGDKWDVKGLKCIDGFCGAGWHVAFPALFALNFGAKFFFMDDPDTLNTVTCPDNGNIVFKVSRIKD